MNNPAQPPNKIVLENQRPGNPPTEWDINGDGDPSIQGFGHDISINLGETIHFKIKTDSTDYRIDIYRMGYYGGMGARLVESIKPSVELPQHQPEGLRDPETHLYDCGNWAISASWQAPVDATSGVYFARLVRQDADNTTWDTGYKLYGDVANAEARHGNQSHAYGAMGHGKLANALMEPRASHIYFIVRDDNGGADILFQTADTTWQAYNRYGGHCTYGKLDPAHPRIHGGPPRAYKVSYNRPFETRHYRAVNMVFNGEYPFIRWLERNGYNVSYFSGVDSDRRGEQIQTHRLFLSVGHDEYWSGNQRKHVEAARDAGVHLAFFSGNEVFWKHRWEPSIATDPAIGAQKKISHSPLLYSEANMEEGPGDEAKETENLSNAYSAQSSGAETVDAETNYRTLVTYKETHDNAKIDPDPNVWTGTWRDARSFNPEGPQPENALTGTIFTVNAWRNDPLIVPAAYSQLRFWRNTDVATLHPGDQAVLLKGLLGHEWDEDIDNGCRPDGLFRLSETTIDNVPYIQDYGTVFEAGTATHHLTLYRHKSGALVFGAGTVQWGWGLDAHHDSETGVPPERANSTSTRVGVDPNGPDRNIQQATVNLFADMHVQPATLQPELIPATATTDNQPPTSTIQSPADGAELAQGATVTISGTAHDHGGGRVAGVEVSVDGGKQWHPTKGYEEWSYQWQPTQAANYTLRCRAVDDSGNLEEAVGEVTVTVVDS